MSLVKRIELFHVAILAGIGWHWRFIAGIADGDVSRGTGWRDLSTAGHI